MPHSASDYARKHFINHVWISVRAPCSDQTRCNPNHIKKPPNLMAAAAAAGAAAEAAAAGCNNPALHWRWDSSLSFSVLFFSPPSLLNHCSNKLSCMLSPIIRRRFSPLGSSRHHLLPGRGCLSSQKRLDPSLWLPPHLPFRSIMLSELLERNCSGERPANGGRGFPPVISPPSKQNTACLWHIAELRKVIESHIWNVSCLCFFPPSVHCTMLGMCGRTL